MAGSGARPPSSIAGGRYQAERQLGSGSFAQIWRGRDTIAEVPVAIKFEDLRNQELMLEDEAELLREITKPSQPQGFARCFHYGEEGPWQCLVMELLGDSLEDRPQACGGRLSVQSVVLVAEQALRRFEYLHSKGIVHRDVKPENFMFGLGSRIHHLYLIDFGLSKRYFWKSGHEPQDKKKVGFTGNARYSSLNALAGVPQTRRDDLEAFGYVLLWLLRGSLPWSGLPRPTPKAVLAKKRATELRELCGGFPSAFRAYLTAVRALGFAERPDYQSLRKMFWKLRAEQGPAEDHHFEWLLGRPLGPLEPLEPWADGPRQPDDRGTGRGGLSSAGGWFATLLAGGGCSCSAPAAECSESEHELA